MGVLRQSQTYWGRKEEPESKESAEKLRFQAGREEDMEFGSQGKKDCLKKPPEPVSTNQSQQIRENTTTALSSEANPGLFCNNKDLFISSLLLSIPLAYPSPQILSL